MNVRNLTLSAIIGAAYASLTFALAPISYGVLQFRVSEVLCILPFFIPGSAWGLFVGCAIANLISAAGLADVVFGSLATLCAGLCTAHIGKSVRDSGTLPAIRHCALACAMPVLFNAPIVGAVLAYSFTPGSFAAGMLTFAVQVGIGEAAVMFGLGLPAMRMLSRVLPKNA